MSIAHPPAAGGISIFPFLSAILYYLLSEFIAPSPRSGYRTGDGKEVRIETRKGGKINA